MENFRLIPKDRLKADLRAREGYRYDEQTDYLIGQAEYLLSVRVADELVFRKLIPCTWVLRDDEQPRTLEAIASRIRKDYDGFDRLIKAHPCHEREWYQRVKDLFERFSWSLLGPVFLTPVKGSRRTGKNEGSELSGTPDASFTIVNGLHSALAAMLRLSEGIDTFCGVPAVLVLPRVDY
jgi:hypothetical protein